MRRVILRKQLVCRMVLTKKPVLWANLGPISELLAGRIRPLSPPIIVLSLPRSGSSWVGNTLGLSSTSLYLREPISQSYLTRNRQSGGPVFEVTTRNLPSEYKLFADAAFRGKPAFSLSIVKYPRQWGLAKRSHRRIVIKEVNPLALGWVLNTYKPKVIYLIRHPAAVAKSFFEMGWTRQTGKLFENKFSPECLAASNFNHERFSSSFWAEHGAFQAVALRLALEQLAVYPESRILKYENLCADPLKVYRELYEFAELQWDRRVEKHILSQSNSSNKNTEANPYSTYRNSEAMVYSWKSELPESAISDVKEAYLSYNPPFYRSEEW